jgi:hypothetical protein
MRASLLPNHSVLTYVVQERINDAANGDRPSRRFK